MATNPFSAGLRPWKRRTAAKVAASTDVLGAGELSIDEFGNVRGHDGVTAHKDVQRLLRLREQAVSVTNYGVVGNGVVDDTAALQAAFTDATAKGLTLRCDPTLNMVIGPVDIAASVTMIGRWRLRARDTDQPYALWFKSSRNNLAGCYLSLEGLATTGGGRAIDGIRGSNIGRSDFGVLDVQRVQRWGINPLRSGNNSQVKIDRLRTNTCGTLVAQVNAVETAETANVSNSITGYATWTLPTPIPAKLMQPDTTQTPNLDLSVYWVVDARSNGAGGYEVVPQSQGGQAYLVQKLYTDANGNATSVEVFNMPSGTGVGGTRTFIVVCGGGINIPSYSDNNYWRIGNHDSADQGVGLSTDSLYGVLAENGIYQGCAIGIAVPGYTIAAVISHPYFENCGVNIVTARYLQGVVQQPTWTGADTVQNLIGRLAGNPHYDARMNIVDGTPPAIFTDVMPRLNPSTVTPTAINPGRPYAFQRTTAGAMPFVVGNDAKWDASGARFLELLLITPGATSSCALTITLKNATVDGAAQTIMGGSSYTVNISGTHLYEIVRVGQDWQVVALTRSDLATSIASPPVRVGQQAIVGTSKYEALQLSSPPVVGDWTLINGPAGSQTPSLVMNFTANATLLKPSGAYTRVRITCIGPGGNGAAGSTYTPSTAASGGGGGGAGGIASIELPFGDLPASVGVVVSAGGSGGDTSVGSLLRARGALSGAGTVAGTGGAGQPSGGSGGAGGASGAAGVSAAAVNGSPTGGGGGGGVPAGSNPTATAGGTGGGQGLAAGLTAGIGGTAPGGAGQTSNLNTMQGVTDAAYPGSGGGGGAGNPTGVGGAGANGNGYGAGGGGGGAGTTGGAGGTGSGGFAQVVFIP